MTHTGSIFRVRPVPPNRSRKRWRLRISKIGGPDLADETVEARDAAHANELACARLEVLEAEAARRFGPDGSATVLALVEQYLEVQARVGTWSPKTARSARRSLARVTDRVGDLTAAQLVEAQPELLADLRERYALSTVELTRAWLRSAWAWALERKLVPGGLPRVAIPGTRSRARRGKRRFSLSESRRVLELLRGDPVAWLPIALLAATGARPSEILGLEARDVDLGAGTLYLRHAKGGRARYVGAPRELLLKLPDTDPLFRNRWGRSLPGDTLRGMLYRVLPEVVPRRNEVSFYSFRKAWASTAIPLGISPLVAKAQLGHAGAGHHERTYAEVAEPQLVEAAELIWETLTRTDPAETLESANADVYRQDRCKGSTVGAQAENGPEASNGAGSGGVGVVDLTRKKRVRVADPGTLERVVDPELGTIATWADENPSAMLRILRDPVLRDRLEAALEGEGREGMRQA